MFAHRRSLDAALVSPGEKTPFPNPDRRPDLRHGMHASPGQQHLGHQLRDVAAIRARGP